MRALWMTLALFACNRSALRHPDQDDVPLDAVKDPAGADSADVLCCCERKPGRLDEPGDPLDRWESRASACVAGTPATPEGRCVDWTGCGHPPGTHRTIAHRPDLAPAVAVPSGACCCGTNDGFEVRARAGCGECLDPDWCVAPASVPPPPHTAAIPGVDRCVQIADHFEPWRTNPDWAGEISPRARLIADCRAQRWSAQLQDCLLAANGPLDLDGCMAFAP